MEENVPAEHGQHHRIMFLATHADKWEARIEPEFSLLVVVCPTIAQTDLLGIVQPPLFEKGIIRTITPYPLKGRLNGIKHAGIAFTHRNALGSSIDYRTTNHKHTRIHLAVVVF